jgi:hypothetical protein
MLLPFTNLLSASRLLRRTTLLLGLAAGSLTSTHAQELVIDRAYPVSDTGYGGESWLHAIATDAQGNVYVGGYFAGYLYCGGQRLVSRASHFDVFVAKYDADGTLLWVQQGGLDGDDRVRSLAVDAAGNVYVAGSYRGPTQFGSFALPSGSVSGPINEDLFVAKLDAAGNWQWATGAAGAGNDFAMTLALGPTGQLTVGGWFDGATLELGAGQALTNQSSAGTSDVFVAQLSTAGKWLSGVRAGGAGSEQLAALAVDAAGTTYACGSFGGQPAQFGATSLPNASAPAGFVARLSPAGEWQWATSLGSAGSSLYSLALDGSGRPYVTGYFSAPTLAVGTSTLSNPAPGASDVVVAALATDGSWRWANRAGDVGQDVGLSLGVSPAGQVTVAGQFYSRQLSLAGRTLLNTSDVGQSEVFVGKLDEAGTWLTGLATTGPGGKEGCYVVVGASGDTYLATSYWGKPTLGGTTLPAAADYLPNIFVAHVANADALPQVLNVAPSSGTAGQPISLTGSNFTDVRSVRFNDVPATYRVESATRITATVPAGAKPGAIRVRTAAGSGYSPAFFTPSTLATLLAEPAGGAQLWPNPVAGPAPLQVKLPTGQPLSGPTRVEVRNSLGQLVAHTSFSGYQLAWAPHLPAGLYQLSCRPAGQPAWQQRLTVLD